MSYLPSALDIELDELLPIAPATAINDTDVRHLKWVRDQIPDQVADLVVLNVGQAAYRRPDGVAVVPLGLLGA